MGTMTQGICKLKNNEKKNKKIQHERMCQGNARIIVIHPFVLFDKMADYIFNKAVKNCECYIDLYMD